MNITPGHGIYAGPPAGSSIPYTAAAAARPCPPGVRWTPLAYALVIGVCAASALLWVGVVAATVVMFGEFYAAQADIAVRLAEITAGPGPCG